MGEKRFDIEYDANCYKCIVDCEEQKIYSSREEIVDLLNSLSEENEQLRKDLKCEEMQVEQWQTEARKLADENEQLKIRLLNCEQKKNDNGGFQVWEMPPIPQGKRIIFTTNNGDV